MFQEYGNFRSIDEEAQHQYWFYFFFSWVALSTFGFSFNATSTSSSYEWIIDSGASYHMANEKSISSTLNECNTKKIYVGDDRSFIFVGFE